MFKPLLSCVGIALAGAGYLQAAAGQQASPNVPPVPAGRALLNRSQPPVPAGRALLNRYCVTCHNERLRTAELLLDKIDVENVEREAEVWEKVVRKLRTGAMPPAGRRRPDQASYDSFATYLETKLDRAAVAKPNPGNPVIHRLNRVEYANAIRDLLAIDPDAVDIRSLLPPDESTHGFDNIASALSVSPLLLERYLTAARKIARLAVGDPAVRPVLRTYRAPKFLRQESRMSQDLPFGSRGGMAIRHYFPADGEYTIKVLLQRNEREYVRGLTEPHELEVRLDGARLNLWTVGGEHKGRSAGLFSGGGHGDPAQEEYERFGADAGLEVRTPVQAGMHLVGISFRRESAMPEGPRPIRWTHKEFTVFKGGDPAVDKITIGGPYETRGVGETPSRRRIFVCRPTSTRDEEPCAGRILSTLAHRAYRRPLTDDDMATLLGFYKNGRDKGDFDAGIGAALERILLGPEFLFRVERDPANVAPDTAYDISDLDLASRLSFFLWSSIPDDQLLNLAEEGKLKNPVVLEQQVRRMLADPRSKTLTQNFGGQWLHLRNLRAVNPDPDVFPYFDENLREAMEQETELFFESIAREDRSVLDLLNADYTFLNERLARHYGIPNVNGSHFRRVKVSDENRRGLLGQSSILTVTSYANRTAPTLRGKWVLDNILAAPPPAPPAVVPALEDTVADGKVLTVREQMEQHRANPACAVCHMAMDPLGFALENFDGIGRWRTTDGKTPIDSSGVLPDGSQFRGPAELRKVLLSKREQFVITVTEKLLTYALGRGLEYYDAPVVRQIMREAAPNDYRWSSFILGVVRSTPFQMRGRQS